MVNSVGTTTTDTTAAAATMKKSIGMNKDDFLKLFITQLQNQDPLSPQDPSEFIGQLAQLTQVEQAYNTNTALQSLITAQSNATTMTSVSFIGKSVKAIGNTVAFDGTSPASLEFNLASSASSAKINISDASGKVVRTANLAPLSAGDTAFAWDGRDGSGNMLPAGAYTFSVAGTSASGTSVATTTFTSGRIDGVRMVDGTPSLMIGPASVSLADVVSIRG